MAKLKCWRGIKTGKRNYTFVNKKSKEMVYLLDTINGFMTNIKGEYKFFVNRKEASTKANKYMKEHNTC